LGRPDQALRTGPILLKHVTECRSSIQRLRGSSVQHAGSPGPEGLLRPGITERSISGCRRVRNGAASEVCSVSRVRRIPLKFPIPEVSSFSKRNRRTNRHCGAEPSQKGKTIGTRVSIDRHRLTTPIGGSHVGRNSPCGGKACSVSWRQRTKLKIPVRSWIRERRPVSEALGHEQDVGLEHGDDEALHRLLR
jgi:hypothetical protein